MPRNKLRCSTTRAPVGATHPSSTGACAPLPIEGRSAEGRSEKRGGKYSRNKGKRGERLLRDRLIEHGYKARRGQQRSGVDQADVIGGPDGFHFEAKFVEKLNVWQAFEQAQRDAGKQTPVVAMKRARSNWLAVVDLEVLLDLIDARDLLS